MVKQSKQTIARRPFSWPLISVCLLTILALLSFTLFTIVHWIEREVLTAETWAATVAELPKNDQIARSLATTTIDQLFTATELETHIEQALPERAGFLVAPLSDQLKVFLTNQTTLVIKSDQFQTVWVTANKEVVERLVNGARAPTTVTEAEPAQLSVPLTVLRDAIRTVLTNRGILNDDLTSGATPELVVNAKASINTLQDYIRRLDFLYATLWLFAIVCALGALIISRNRRRLLMIMAVSVIVISLLQLIGIRALQPALLNFFSDVAASSTTSIVYDTLLESFRQQGIWTLLFATLFALIVFLTKPQILRKSHTLAKWLDSLKTSSAAGYWKKFRSSVAIARWYIVGFTTLAGLVLFAFVLPVNWTTVTLFLLFIILIAELTSLVAAGSRRRVPMK